MRRHGPIWLLLAALAVAACEKAAPPPPEPDPAPPSALLAYGELPSTTDLSALTDAVSQISPEAGPMVATALPMQLGQMMGAHLSSTDAVDLAGPLRVLVLDPEAHPDPMVFVVRAKGALEAKKGSRVVALGDFAAFGAPEAVAAVEGYAAHLTTVPVAGAKIVAFPGHLLAAYGDTLAGLPELVAAAPASETGGVDLGQILSVYVDLIEALAADSELATLTVSSEQGAAHFHLELSARAGSDLAKFYAAQEVAPFTAHERLPAVGDVAFFGDWVLHAGPLLPAMLRYSETIFTAAMGDKAEGMQEWLRRHADLLTGDGAMAMTFAAGPVPSVQGVAAYGVSDGEAARRALIEGFALWSGKVEMFGVKSESRFSPEAATHGGVPIARQVGTTQATDPSTGSSIEIEQLAHFAAVDGAMLYGLGEDSEALVRGAIDVAAGKGQRLEPSGTLKRALEHARAAKASALTYMDMSDLAPPAAGPMPTFAMTLAFSERTMTFTMSFLR